MEIWEVLLIGVALAMDAFAASLTDGMVEPNMKGWKVALVAGLFGLFQFGMPVLGYYFGYTLSFLVQKIAPWLSFFLLLLIGVKGMADGIGEMRAKKRGEEPPPRGNIGAGKLLLQAVATSIDALAVGITFLAVETSEGLPMSAVWCSVLIGVVTFTLSVVAVFIGKKAGNRFADKAEIFGGAVLIGIGIKILLEGLL